MIRASVSLAALALALAATTASAQPSGPAQALERSFDAQISSADQLAWLQQMSSAPNHVGSPHDKANADFELALFKQWGWDAHIERFDVLYPTPISTTVELISPHHVVLGGQEPAVAEDPTSSNTAGALPPYVAYQGDGDVTAPVVYVNYGMPNDYDALEQRGISVKGKIVLARYGGGWRGLKPKLAQQHGAVGCLIYSDPADDSYAAADVYPRGGGRPEAGIQRGSVADMPTYPGDPLTPGVGATPNAKRLSRAEAKTILKIPTLPISYRDATRIIAALQGPLATGRQRGALGMAYHWGGTDAVQVHLAVKSDWSLKPVYDVIGMLHGSAYPDQWIVRGNHHDGWVFGASDPLTGQVALMSEAKALGALYRSGWRPARTIVYASWDGEEPGLLGSTEWAETHAAELKQKALLYINTDSNGRGFLFAAGSHELQHFVNQASGDVADPRTGVSSAQRGRAAILAGAYLGTDRDTPDVIDAAKSGGDLPLGALGSGSDYTAFLQHLGIASLNLGFGGEDQSDGSYHSVYDSFYHVTHFDDPGQGRRADRDARRRWPTRSRALFGLRRRCVALPHRDQEARRRPAREGPHARRPPPRGRLHARRLAQRPDRRPGRPRNHPAGRHAAAGERGRPSEARRIRRRRDARPRGQPAARDARPHQCQPRADRPAAARSRGPARPAVVPEFGLRARDTHRLRRQDAARRARGDRAAPLR